MAGREQSLKDKVATGLFWGGLSNGVQQLLNFLFGIFLARLLTPADYGMIGMLAIFSLIAGSLQESGFTSALAIKRNVTHRDYNAVFWFSTGMGISLYVILFFCSPLIARFYYTTPEAAEKIPVFTALARYSFLSIIVTSLGTAHNAYLFRNLLTRQKAFSTVTALIISGITGISLAYFGFAYWGIATQNLVYVVSITVCYWHFASWRPSFQIDFRPLKSMIGFSSRLLLTNIFNHINNNLFSIILGKFYSEKDVGHFGQANKWNYMGHSLITGMVGGIAQPVLSQTSDEQERQRLIFRKMLRFTAFVSFPAMLGLSLIAPQLIVITITDVWLPSAQILQWLCISGAFIPIIFLYSNLIISKGKSKIYMWNTIAMGIVQLILMLLIYPYGIHTMVKVYVSVHVCWLLVWHYFVWKEIRLSLYSALRDILPFGVIATGVILVTYYLTIGITNIILLFVAKVLIAAILYIFIMWISRSVTFRESVAYFIRNLQNKSK